jgi:outer membrane protein assembly factor BamE (lipoprotein component of BamABCDE complex)
MNGSLRKNASSLLRTAALSALLLSPLAACTTAGPQTQGYVIDEQAVAEIKPGMDAKKVLSILGTPSTVSTVGNQSWYYISQNTNRKYMFQKPEITDQRVLAVMFTKALKVESIANYGMKDGEVFDFNKNATPTGGTDLSIVRQMLRMVGST